MTDEVLRTRVNSRSIGEMVGGGRLSAAAARFLLGEDDRSATETLFTEIRGIATDPAMPILLRRYAIAALSQDQRDVAVSTLLGLATQNDADPTLKSGALWALGSHVKGRQDVQTVLEQSLISEDGMTQFSALYNLGASAIPIPLASLLELVRSAESMWTSVHAVEILAEQKGQEAIPYLRQFVDDASAEGYVRERSKKLLEWLATHESYAPSREDGWVMTITVTIDGVADKEVLYPIFMPPLLKEGR